MQIINKNILTVDRGVICHQVNSMGVMGTGIALSIKQKWPKVFEEYRNKLLMPRYKNLGNAQIIEVSKELFVVNLFGQYDFGRDYRRTEYGSIYAALKSLQKWLYSQRLRSDYKFDLPIYFPWKMSCNNAGGNWNLLMEMLDELFPDCYICKID